MWRKFYSTFIDLPTGVEGEIKVVSPYRIDTKPSLGINLKDSRWFDFGLDFGGTAVTWLTHWYSIPRDIAEQVVLHYTKTHEIKYNLPLQSEVDYCARKLQDKKYLVERGLNAQTIEKYQLGFDERSQRYTIPIYSLEGIPIQIKTHDPSSIDKYRVNPKGVIEYLYPWVGYDKTKPTILCEGDFDALILRQHGFNSLTLGSASSVWYSDWQFYMSKEIYICMDNDTAGLKAAQKLCRELKGNVKVILLPEKDITDFFLKGGTAIEFTQLMKNAVSPSLFLASETKTSNVEAISLHQQVHQNYVLKSRSEVRIVGRVTAPYEVPIAAIFQCTKEETNSKCEECVCSKKTRTAWAQEYPELYLDYIKIQKAQKIRHLKTITGILPTCNYCKVDITQTQKLHELYVSNPYDNKVYTCFYAGTDIIEANTSYEMEMIAIPNPWDQGMVFVSEKVKPTKQALDNFCLSEEDKQELKIFQQEDLSIEDKLIEIHKDFEKITDIVGRRDLLTAIDLTYHSALAFEFQGFPVQKGYIECLLLGDTRTGKSETMLKMLEHFQQGELSTAENTSYAGLIGGCQQQNSSKSFFVTWGALPRNDRKLFVIDEASGLSLEDIGSMSGVRSSGIAEITKIVTEKAPARTRMIWLSNPRERRLNTFTYGVQAIVPLIGKPEDIARFDFAVAASADDVPIEDINTPRRKTNNILKYSSDLCQKLVLWAWSRKKENIAFTEDAELAILKYAIIQGKRYSNQIPLVEGANQRIKLAKIAVAIALRLFATEDGENILVTKEHVEFAYNFLEETYRKPSLDYISFSRAKQKETARAVNAMAEIYKYLKKYKDICYIISSGFIKKQTYTEALGTNSVLEEIFQILVKKGFLKERGGYYIAQPELIRILKRIQSEEETPNEEDKAFK